MKNMELLAYEEKGWIEVKRYPMHLPESMIIADINTDMKLKWQAIAGQGIYLMTVGAYVSFMVNLKLAQHLIDKNKQDFIHMQKQLRLTPSYNNKVPKRRHHPHQKDSD